jgi:hypothetical protein
MQHRSCHCMTHSAGNTSCSKSSALPNTVLRRLSCVASGGCLWCAGQGVLLRSSPEIGPHLSCKTASVAASISSDVCQTSCTGRWQSRTSRSTCKQGADRLRHNSNRCHLYWQAHGRCLLCYAVLCCAVLGSAAQCRCCEGYGSPAHQ